MNLRPSVVLCAEKEKIQDLGEDAFAYSFTEDGIGYISVFDGCGGMGSKKYAKLRNMSGAKLASALAAYLTDEAYNQKQLTFTQSDNANLKANMKRIFTTMKSYLMKEETVKIGGSLFRSIPTTASIVLLHQTTPDKVQCKYLWAGDSRGYFLDSEGMCQITKDDLDTEEDAFSNLRSDARLENVINGDTDFRLNERTIELKAPAAVITATDGAFGYFTTPMEFEYAILQALYRAGSVSEWEKGIESYISGVAGDDFAIIIAMYGVKTFAEIQQYFRQRFEYLTRTFIAPAENADEQKLRMLWNQYSTTYYRR